jgi:PqqD family protein of HPr-rel-A system
VEDGIDTVWRIAAALPIPRRNWEGDWVVYNPLSGDTHILDVVAGDVLSVVVESPTGARAICRHIADFLDVPDDENTRANVAEILHRLDELGLIEPVPGC